jgi:hypothetical protein
MILNAWSTSMNWDGAASERGWRPGTLSGQQLDSVLRNLRDLQTTLHTLKSCEYV